MSSLERIARAPWQDAAACAGEAGMLFYPPLRAEPKAVRLRREARALAVCAQCVVRDDCLRHAVDNNERYGIWGGLTDRERRLALVESAPGQPGAADADVAAPTGDSPTVEF